MKGCSEKTSANSTILKAVAVRREASKAVLGVFMEKIKKSAKWSKIEVRGV